jgi:hypothetical protein
MIIFPPNFIGFQLLAAYKILDYLSAGKYQQPLAMSMLDVAGSAGQYYCRPEYSSEPAPSQSC